MRKICAAQDCITIHYAKSYCKKHYAQIARHGRLTPEREHNRIKSLCASPNCDKFAIGSQKYCRKHYRQTLVHKRLTPEYEYKFGNKGCIFSGCKNKHRAKGLCSQHYNRIQWIMDKYKAATGNKLSFDDAIESISHIYI